MLIEVEKDFWRGWGAPWGPPDKLKIAGVVQLALFAHTQGRHHMPKSKISISGLTPAVFNRQSRLVEKGLIIDKRPAAQIDGSLHSKEASFRLQRFTGQRRSSTGRLRPGMPLVVRLRK